MRTVTLSECQMGLCRLFSEWSARSQQRIEFGERSTAPRSIAEIARDNLIGKMAEAAVCSILHECGDMQAAVNYEILPRGAYDGFDLVTNGWTLDVKSTRKGSYLLFDANKVRFRAEADDLPDVIVMCRTAWDAQTDAPMGSGVDVLGCISAKRLLRPDGKKVRFLRRGDLIPGTACKLQTDNYAVALGDLSDFTMAARYMREHKKNTLGGTYGKKQGA